MNPSIARKRLQQVLRVDAVNSSQSDFLATHVPFRNVVISKRENGVLSEDTMTEEVYLILYSHVTMYPKSISLLLLRAPVVQENRILLGGCTQN